MSLTAEEQAVLGKMCEIFNIPIEHTADNPEHALGIVNALYAYSSIDEDYEQDRHRTAVLTETKRVWTDGSSFPAGPAFWGDVQRVVALQLHQRYYFVNRRKSNAELIREYKAQLISVMILEIIGVGGLTGALRSSGAKGVEAAIKAGATGSAGQSVRAGVAAASQRLLLGGGSGIVEASVLRWGAAAGLWAAAFVAAMVIAHELMLRNLEQIRDEIADRYAKDPPEATEDEYEQVQNRTMFEIVAEGFGAFWE